MNTKRLLKHASACKRGITCSTHEKRTGMKGVDTVLLKALALRVTEYVQHSDSIILVKKNTKPNKTVIIQTYMPKRNV